MGRLRREDGNVVIATAITVLMVAIGLATLSAVDTQTRQSRVERERESSFNLTEGVLHAQTFVMSRLGTDTASRPFPAKCPATPASDLCPDPAAISRSYDEATQVDFKAGQTSWSTEVRDNTNGSFYDGSVDSAPRYDANGDKQLWVKATGTVRTTSMSPGRTRSIVALVRVENRPIRFPRYAISSGYFFTTNNGNKTIVDATGSLGVSVRCSTPPPSTGCLDYDAAKGQLKGNYVLNNPNPTAISADDLQALEDYAKAQGSYHASCPSNPNGAVVVVESGNCSYNNSAPAAAGESECCNSAASPGLLIIKSGTLSLNGSIEFHGLVYAPNLQKSTGTIVEIGGTALISGGVMVDAGGGVAAGSSGLNVEYRAPAFDKVSTTGTAGVVQNTWREIIPDQ